MSYHCRCVAKATRRALVVGDLPFLSYQISIDKAVESAGRLIKEGGVAAVKLEGGLPMAATIERLTQVDIPVMGHVGLTPQSFHRMGGHKIQGRISAGANGDLIAGTRERILEDAMAVERAGAFAVVLEGIPAELAAEITAALSIPTIGIGAGPQCDGQILVSTDLLGLNPEFKPRFVKRYAEFGEAAVSAVSHFIDEVHAGVFPAAEHSFGEAVLTQNKSRSGLKLA
jgi:3-methyl-2-oxobutanoate hydroxymethyltransferase